MEYEGWILTGNSVRRGNCIFWESICPICNEGVRWRQKASMKRHNSCHKCASKLKRGNNSPHWKGAEHVPASVLAKIRCTLVRGRTLECRITVEDLEDVWIKQNGSCCLTGLPLSFPEVLYTNENKKKGSASVDRIDSSIGYVKGNIQFVDKRINNMKQDLSQEEFIDLCKMVAEKM